MELLVVIGIISVLISLLLPTLSRARENAQLLSCRMNMRTIYNAYIDYSQRYHDHFPDPDTLGGSPPYRAYPGRSTAGQSFDPSGKTVGPEIYGIPALFVSERLVAPNSKVWICPSAAPPFQDWGVTYEFPMRVDRSDDVDGRPYWTWTSVQRGRQRYKADYIDLITEPYQDLPYFSGRVRDWRVVRNGGLDSPAFPRITGSYLLMPHKMTVRMPFSSTVFRNVPKGYNRILLDGSMEVNSAGSTKIR